ncbi:ATP-dependent protease subunit HslV [Thiospirochaeta perfilievii]|uniref:ATP-dependent protease subunit HslV n=1 Tax=Thiospirochaeta perfilievii TaxID=252967 RepID=A0A5C1Q9Z9_9SPIO|nr:ATP-dependent protease subunit HslV [Thiospirochaeta perfilievii]QEN03739.1 ATP-dependent protease subunit HslV [Thiospirochaeta perfilievii]
MDIRGTTILAVKKDGVIALAGDGQVTLGNATMKGNARKVRRIYGGKVVVGFAGSTADAFTLEELFEDRLNQFNGDITRAAVELAKEWRTDRALRKLEAMLLVADKDKIYLLSGNGDVIEPEHGAIAIGSGGNFAYAAALAFLDSSDLDAGEIAKRSLHIAGNICIYTNNNIILEVV